MTNQIAVRDDRLEELEHSFAIAVKQRELLANYIKERMTPGKHFYQVGDSKNSLTKEGAELICLPHGYKPAYTVEGGPDQPPENDTPYQITVRCTLHKGETFEGEGMGSASSHVTTKSGERKPRQPDIGLRHNATLKMAQKSAYIAATLNATAASEFFTQDMEDGAEATERKTEPQDNRYHCPEHNVNWTKHTSQDGKSTWYSHKQGNGWCNIKDARLDAKDKRDWTEQDRAAASQQPSETTGPAEGQGAPSDDGDAVSGPEFPDLGSVYTYAQHIGFPTMMSRMDVPGFQQAVAAKDWSKAAGILKTAKQGA